MAMATATSAWGQVGDESRTIVRVTLSDLDLTLTEDRARLDRRLKSAIEQVCGSPSAFDLVGQNHLSVCRNQARAQALMQRNILQRSTAIDPRSTAKR